MVAQLPRLPDRSQWVQLTKFPDSVSEPALSPDGHMVAFIRGYGLGQVYIKILPDGEPVQLAHDNLYKKDPTFSPDGSRVAYTTFDPQQFDWDTWVVPTLGGEPQPLLRNASGLVWIDSRQVLFSEIKAGVHMGSSHMACNIATSLFFMLLISKVLLILARHNRRNGLSYFLLGVSESLGELSRRLIVGSKRFLKFEYSGFCKISLANRRNSSFSIAVAVPLSNFRISFSMCSH